MRPPYNPDLEKYWHKRRSLFSKYDHGIALDAESYFSVTPEAAAAATASQLSDGACVLVDAFCGVGGNAIQQALHDPHGCVIAIDIDPLKIEMARHNAEIYGVADRIQFVVGDFMEIAPRLRADVVFLSPPWGGVDYSPKGEFRLSALDVSADVDGVRLFELAIPIAPTIAYYLPVSTSDLDLGELAAKHASRRCERIHLLWGDGKRVRPRALLACYRIGPTAAGSTTASPSPSGDAPPSVHASSIDCR